MFALILDSLLTDLARELSPPVLIDLAHSLPQHFIYSAHSLFLPVPISLACNLSQLVPNDSTRGILKPFLLAYTRFICDFNLAGFLLT